MREREKKFVSTYYTYASARMWRSSACEWVRLAYIYVYIHEYGHMRREFTTFKMYVSDIGHYIRGRRYRRTSVPIRILLKTFYSPSSLSAPGRPTYPYPSPIIHYPSDSITHTPAPRKSVQKPEYRIYCIVYSTYNIKYSLFTRTVVHARIRYYIL